MLHTTRIRFRFQCVAGSRLGVVSLQVICICQRRGWICELRPCTVVTVIFETCSCRVGSRATLDKLSANPPSLVVPAQTFKQQQHKQLISMHFCMAIHATLRLNFPPHMCNAQMTTCYCVVSLPHLLVVFQQSVAARTAWHTAVTLPGHCLCRPQQTRTSCALRLLARCSQQVDEHSVVQVVIALSSATCKTPHWALVQASIIHDTNWVRCTNASKPQCFVHKYPTSLF